MISHSVPNNAHTISRIPTSILLAVLAVLAILCNAGCASHTIPSEDKKLSLDESLIAAQNYSRESEYTKALSLLMTAMKDIAMDIPAVDVNDIPNIDTQVALIQQRPRQNYHIILSSLSAFQSIRKFLSSIQEGLGINEMNVPITKRQTSLISRFQLLGNEEKETLIRHVKRVFIYHCLLLHDEANDESRFLKMTLPELYLVVKEALIVQSISRKPATVFVGPYAPHKKDRSVRIREAIGERKK